MKPLVMMILALPLSAAPVYTSSASSAIECQWNGGFAPPDGKYVVTVDGKSACPASYRGPTVLEAIGPLSVAGGTGGVSGSRGFFGNATYDFSSGATDTLVATGGQGAGFIEFTLTWDWKAGDDVTAFEQALAEFTFNGQKVWHDTGLYDGGGYGFPHSSTIVLDEPFIFGMPFTWGAKTEVNGAGNGSSIVSSGLHVNWAPLGTYDSISETAPVPEPATLPVVFVGLVVMAVTFRNDLVSGWWVRSPRPCSAPRKNRR